MALKNTTDHEANRLHLLSEVTQLERSLTGISTSNRTIQPLLNKVAAYLESDTKDNRSDDGRVKDDVDDDEFGDIDDDELISAETGAIIPSQSANIADPDQHVDKKLKIDKPEPDILVSSDLEPRALSEASALARSILQKTWGFPAFRLAQEAAISRLIGGGSAVVVFPTGGGKSLVYQVPALAFDEWDEHEGSMPGGGVTLVVSPLIALMKDQVDALNKRGICAAAMDSSQPRDVWLESCDNLRSGKLKLLYVAPERLNNEGFVEMISHTKVRLVAVDEAHCISQWGHAFRPDYLKVARFTREVQAERVLCLTATATPQVASDICAGFEIPSEAVFRTSSFRPNLRLLAQSFTNNEEKKPYLVTFLRANRGSTIVYVQTQKQTEEVCAQLIKKQLAACSYHAGMSADIRTRTQEKFMHSNNLIIVATIAFGMGIDKSDIRNIVHYMIPKSLEGYSQEIGRAGRDGLPSTCIIYLCDEDIGIMEDWARADTPSLQSVEGLVGGLLEVYQSSKPGDVVERNLNHESKDWDVKMNTLNLLNAQLEIRFELLRAITCKYSEYKFALQPTFNDITNDGTKPAETIRNLSITSAKKSVKWKCVDVDQAAALGKFSRAQAVQKLQEWNARGAIELKPTGVIHRFRIIQKLPASAAARKKISRELYQHFEDNEKSNIDRIQDVITFLTSASCLSKTLAAHFGDHLSSSVSDGCGNCNFCISGKSLEYKQGATRNRKGRVDKKRFDAVLAATEARDDARFLTRVAFGIGSPRITKEGLAKSEVFGSMEDCDFEELLTRFETVCKWETGTLAK